ncbi:acyl-CoA desaturase [Paraburkholderia jirisanensis]
MIRQIIAFSTILIPTLLVPVAVWIIGTHGMSYAEIMVFIVMYCLSIMGVEMGFHRLFSHRSFATGPVLKSLLVILGSMAAQGPLIQWVSNHRTHHRFVDDIGDPHSPYASGGPILAKLWHAHLGWLFEHTHYDPTIYSKDILRDPLLMAISRRYHLWVLLGLVLPGLVLFLVEKCQWNAFLEGMLFGGFVRIFAGHHAVWAINSFGHYFGSRPFNTRGQSRNNLWLVIPTLGGGWHNNHHAYPASAVNGCEWWQFDPIGLVILLMGKFRLVHDIRRINKNIRDIVA